MVVIIIDNNDRIINLTQLRSKSIFNDIYFMID